MRHFRPAVAAFLLMMAMALTTTALSFFVVPVCEELGVGRGAFALCYSLLTASGTVGIPVLGQVIQRHGVRPVVMVSTIWVALGFLVFSLSGSLWVFYGAACCMGVFGTACVSLCATVMVQQRYCGARASTILGIVMAGSGVGGMLVSLCLPGVIQQMGWRMGYRLLAACWLTLGITALVVMGKGERRSVSLEDASADGMTRTQALHSPKFYLLIAVSFILSAACGIQQQLPSVLSGYGFAAGQVSLMMSFFTGALALGKIGHGLFYGRVGAVRGGSIVTFLFAASFVMLLKFELVWPGLAALAVGMGAVTTLMPLLTRFAFGSREYAAIWGILSGASNAGALVATPLFGMAYDLSGAYRGAMLAAMAALLLCMVLMHLCFGEKRQFSPKNPLDRNL